MIDPRPPLDRRRTAIAAGIVAATAAAVVACAHRQRGRRRRSRDGAGDGERHAAVLEIVAAATTEVVALAPEDVLDRVVAVMARLGFWRGGMWMVEGDVFVLRASIEEQDQLGEEPLSDGVGAEALRTGGTVVVADYRAYPDATESGRAIGLRGVVATPIVARGAIVAILAGGLDRPWTDDDAPLVRATELLAGTAGRALEVAARYAAEQRTVTELRRIDELKDDFLATVSHEMRTPLAVLLGTTETLLARWRALDDDTRRHLLQRAVHNGHALNSVIDALLDFRKLERGTWTYRPDTVRLDRLTARVTDRIATILEHHEVELVLEPAFARGDAQLLERVIENLLVNTARHTPAGTAVRIAVMDRPDGVELQVADDGPGIAAEDLERLEERFFRGGDPETRDARGLGLGLALVREILDLHGTTLRIVSRRGEGSTFSFTLERARPLEDGAHADEAARRLEPNGGRVRDAREV